MHTQNSRVENTPSIMMTFGDSMILTWRRQILTRLPTGKTKWQTDKNWQNIFNMNIHYITITNPLDECPTYNTILDTKVKYQHDGVKVIANTISVGYVFRVVKTVKEYNISNNVMMCIMGPKRMVLIQKSFTYLIEIFFI